MKTIALALNILELQAHFDQPEIVKRYPGAGFLPHLAKIAKKNNVSIIGASQIPGNSEVHVLQEEFNQDGFRLVTEGARAQVVFCMESKMYAPHFYDAIPEFKKRFKYQILFEQGTHLMRFPSYDMEELDRPIFCFKERKELCMISSNKQWWSIPGDWKSPSYCEAIRNELHTARLHAIHENPDMDLYGYGWDNLDNLPPHWVFLKPQIQKMWKGVVRDKKRTLEQYESAYCYENVDIRNYVTEKTIDCQLAGTKALQWRALHHSFYYPLVTRDFSHEKFAEQVWELLEI